jgi:hypothetical protein
MRLIWRRGNKRGDLNNEIARGRGKEGGQGEQFSTWCLPMAACCAPSIGSVSIATNGLYTVAEQAQIPNLPAVIEDGNREIEPSLLGSRLMLTTSYKKEEGRLEFGVGDHSLVWYRYTQTLSACHAAIISPG